MPRPALGPDGQALVDSVLDEIGYPSPDALAVLDTAARTLDTVAALEGAFAEKPDARLAGEIRLQRMAFADLLRKSGLLVAEHGGGG